VLPQAYDEVVDRARVGVSGEVPNIMQNGLAGNYLAGMVDEVAQQLRLHLRERDSLAAGLELERGEVYLLPIEAKDVIFAARRFVGRGSGAMRPLVTTQQRLQPGYQNAQFERLGQVVVRAGFETLQHVFGAAARGEHQDW